MPRYYHVTKLDKVPNIRATGLKVSSGSAAGGMSADSNEAYKYAEQDKDLIYMWTKLDYTDKFKKDSESYALILVDVSNEFAAQHIRPPKGNIGDLIVGTTAVCDADIGVGALKYYKEDLTKKPNAEEFELVQWGGFNIEEDSQDRRIWGGLDDDSDYWPDD